MEANKKFTLILPEKLHTELKILATLKKTSMKELIVDCVEKILKEEKEKTK